MKLEVGMYVRLKDNEVGNHIAQIKQLLGLDNMTQLNVFHVFSNYEWERVYEDDVTKASHNLIDLIEEGDYVNGERVDKIDNKKDWWYIYSDNTKSYDTIIAGKDEDGMTKPIKSILTKEQYEANVYKVGDGE